MSDPHRRFTFPRLVSRWIGLPGLVFRDADGLYCTDHPLVKGRFTNLTQLRNTVRSLKPVLESWNRRPEAPQPPSPTTEKLGASAAESASSLALEEPLVEFLDTTSSEEWITGTLSHYTCLSSDSTFNCEKLVAGDVEFASGQAVQDPDVASSKGLLGSTSLEESNSTGPKTLGSSREKFVVGAVDSVPAVQELDVSSLDMLEFRLLVTKPLTTPLPPPSGKLVTGAVDFAPAVPLQEPDVSYFEEFLDTASSKELITASSGTESHNTCSYSVSSRSCDKPVAGAAEFTYEQALQDPNIASSKELLDTISLGELSCEKFAVGAAESVPVVQDQHNLDIDKIMAELSSEESITTSHQKMPHNTTDGSCQPASPLGSKIFILRPPNCYQKFYIRMDQTGSFWTYPDVGGPFHSVFEADIAIMRFIEELWDAERIRCNQQDGFSHGDRMIHDHRYYLYGPPMKDPNSPSSKTDYDGEKYLIQALLDKYNADNNLFGDLAHELKDLLRKKIIPENPWWYCHLNFTTKQQADDSTGNKLFFAELSYMLGEKTWQINCCCIIETQDDDGGHCYGCRNMSDRMQHPKNTNAYSGGHIDAGCCLIKLNDEDEEDSDADVFVDEYDMDDDDDDDDDDDVEDYDSDEDNDMEEDVLDEDEDEDVEEDGMEGYVDSNNVEEAKRRARLDKWMNSLVEELRV